MESQLRVAVNAHPRRAAVRVEEQEAPRLQPHPVGGATAAPPGLNAQKQAEIDFSTARAVPRPFLPSSIGSHASGRKSPTISHAVGTTLPVLRGGIIDTVNESGVTTALRGLTALKGRALDVEVYPANHRGRTLSFDLQYRMGSGTHYDAAVAYLHGNVVEGARLELQSSLGFFNDDEARIEATMRALTPDQLQALGAQHAGALDNVRDALMGLMSRSSMPYARATMPGRMLTACATALMQHVARARLIPCIPQLPRPPLRPAPVMAGRKCLPKSGVPPSLQHRLSYLRG